MALAAPKVDFPDMSGIILGAQERANKLIGSGWASLQGVGSQERRTEAESRAEAISGFGRPNQGPTETPETYEDVIQMNAQGTRRLALSDRLRGSLNGSLASLGLGFEVFSGGQVALGEDGPRTGSTRHDHGDSADGYFTQNGSRLDPRNDMAHRQLVDQAIRQLRANGITGIGHGPGYMDQTHPGAFHVGFGNEAVWGAGGSGTNAVDWVANAFYGR